MWRFQKRKSGDLRCHHSLSIGSTGTVACRCAGWVGVG